MRAVISIICFVCCFIFDDFETSNATSLKELNFQLSRIDEVRAQFFSAKHLASLDTMLDTQGELFISRANGIVIKQTKPFFLKLTAKKDLIKEESEDSESKVYTRNEFPEIFNIYDSISNRILNFDQQQLQEDFNLSFKDLGDHGYEMLLIPRQKNTAELEYIKICGLFFPNLIKYKISGDETTVKLSEIQIKHK